MPGVRRFVLVGGALLAACQLTDDSTPQPPAPRSAAPAPAPRARAQLPSSDARAKALGSLPNLEAPIDGRRYRLHRPGLGQGCSTTVVHDLDTRTGYWISPESVKVASTEAEPVGPYSWWQFDRCVPKWARSRGSDATSEGPGNRAYERPTDEQLQRVIAPGGNLYWMSHDGEACLHIRPATLALPKHPKPRAVAYDRSLEAFAATEVPDNSTWARLRHPTWPGAAAHDRVWYPVVLTPPRDGHLGSILFGTPQSDAGRPALKCRCERLLRFLRVDDSEIHVVGRRLEESRGDAGHVDALPSAEDEVPFYDVGDVERWFWTKQACEAAREEALASILADGRQSVHVGFSAHVYHFY